MDYNTILLNFSLLHNLKPYEKLGIDNNELRVYDQVYNTNRLAHIHQALARWWRRENRNKVLTFLHYLYATAELTLRSLPITDTWRVSRLYSHLLHSKTGLQTLRETYCDDPQFVLKLKLLDEYTTNLVDSFSHLEYQSQ
jgi:hypothetical protein